MSERLSETALLASHPSNAPLARRKWPSAGWVLARVLAIAVALELVYLLAANLMLSTKLVEKLAASTDDIKLTYRTGWSLWPGHVEVRNLSLRAKDYNVEFFIQVDAATVDIAISDLFRKRFHATSVRTTGTVFRMRHHVHSVGDDGPRIAAYPSIEGLPDPPLYVGPEQPALPDAEYNLWEIQLEDVHAELAEAWILEYRYRGAGTASGRFHLRPARWFEVGPAALELRGGRLTVDDVPVAERASGMVDCFAEHTDVENVTGLAVLHRVSAGARLALEGTDLSFANVYTRSSGVRLSGHGSGRVDLSMKNAVLVPGGVFEFAARPFEVQKGKVHFGGPVDLAVRVGPPEAEGGTVVEVSSRELIGAIRDKETPSPSLHGLTGRAVIEPRDVRKDFEVTGTELAVSRASAPSLGWFNPLLEDGPKLAGSATLRGRVSTSKAHGVDADAKATFEGLKVQLEDTWFRAEGGSLKAAAKSSPDDRKRLDVSELDLDVKNLTLQDDDEHTPPLTATLRGEDVRIQDLSPFAASGTLRAHAEPAVALLPLFIGSGFLRSLLDATLGLDRLDARVAFRTSRGSQRLEVLDLRSGKLEARGLWQSAPRGKPEGAFLIADPLNLGLRIGEGKTHVKVFAGDGWLRKELAKLGDGTPGGR